MYRVVDEYVEEVIKEKNISDSSECYKEKVV